MDYTETFIELTNLEFRRIRLGISIADLVHGTPYSEETYRDCLRGDRLVGKTMVNRLKRNLEEAHREKHECRL